MGSYLKKTNKGFINLSTFGFENSFKLIDNRAWLTSMNHHSLSILDKIDVNDGKNPLQVLFLYRDAAGLVVAFEQEDILMKMAINYKEELIFN